VTPEQRERARRLRIRLVALRRHAAARGPDGRSSLAVEAGRASGRTRQGDRVWGLSMALQRWHPEGEADRSELSGDDQEKASDACVS